MLMRFLRTTVIVVFVAVFAAFGFYFVRDEILADKTVPVITVEEETLEVSIKATNEDLLKGVTAYDEKDKDLTDKVVVESISRFGEIGVCTVTYAVCDSDNHVSTAKRKIRYTDYTSPKIYLQNSPCYSLLESADIFEAVRAKCCIDGDITNQMIVTSENYGNSVEGVFTIDAIVTNSKGDTVTSSLPLIIEDRKLGCPKIELSEYLIYAEKGQKFDFRKYLVGAINAAEEPLDITPTRIETDYNPDVPGTYLVHYYLTDAFENEGHTVLVVIVE